MVIAKWQGERNDERFQAVLDNPDLAHPEQPEEWVLPHSEEIEGAPRFTREPAEARPVPA
jgi:hypothetical protein